uniref:EGF-like domain-containing protein n=1 Tax=Panagrolaimus superbus TaxID=310955 RepID=A0A914YX55_9BILA
MITPNIVIVQLDSQEQIVKHGGKCVADSSGTEVCECLDIWKGTNCEIFESCLYWTCDNGGACYANSTDNIPKCSCVIGWEGKHCETMTDNCSPNPCIYTNAGVSQTAPCINKIADYTCSCPSGTSTKNCSVNYDDCKKSGSNNICTSVDKSATCVDGLDDYTCTCGAAYYGVKCEITDNCKPNPCNYTEYGVIKQANCKNKVADFECSCPSGANGKTCSDNSDDCQRSGKGLQDNLCNTADKNANCSDGLDSYKCSCSVAYSGIDCKTYNACYNIVCKNGGTCSTVDNQPLCACVKGYEGTLCETITNNCDPNPCIYEEWGVQKKATCTNKVADYTCTCPFGTTSKNCSINMDDCKWNGAHTTNLCNTADKDATCLDGLNNYTCICGPAYTGPQSYNACFNVTCENAGNCSTVSNKPKCTCVKGYEGPLCETVTDNCSPNPCIYTEFGVKNETICTNQIGDYTCDCPSGSQGKNCTDNPDDCKKSGSNNICTSVDKKATCLDGLNEYKCACSAAYKDDLCTTYDACFNITCSNGGTCSTVDNKFKCTCPIGWEGDKCQIMINNCNPNPCVYTEFGVKKNAACTNKLADYDCSCPAGTSGKNCEFNNDDCIFNGTSVCNTADMDATCSDGLDKYACKCGPAYKDDQCTITNNCNPNPCIYVEYEEIKTANCTNKIGDYTCSCPSGTSDGLNNYTCACSPDYKGNQCQNGLNEYKCTCSADYTGPQCKMTVIVWKVAQLFGGIDDIINLLEDVVKTPSLIKDLVPFLLGQQPRDNQSAMSWDFEELFEWASYEKHELDYKRDFTLTFDTTLGNCYTFNNGNCSRRWFSRKSGQDGGFRAKMRVRQNQYLAWIDTASLLVFVHPPEESIFAESVRYQVAPNTSTSIITQRNAYSRLSGKYGTCIKDKEEVVSYYYSGDYTTAGCFRGCYQDAVFEECGCMDPRYAMPEEMSACNMSVWNCVKGITAEKGDASTWTDCKCPSPCSESQFDSAYAKSSFPSYYFGCEGLKSDVTKYKYCMGNYTDSLFISVYIPKLTRKVFAEVPAMTVS